MSNLLRKPIVLSLLMLLIAGAWELILIGIVFLTGIQIRALGAISCMAAAFLVGAIYHNKFKEALPRKVKLKISLNVFVLLSVALGVVWAVNYTPTPADGVPNVVKGILLLGMSLFFSLQIYVGLGIYGFVMRGRIQ